MTVTGTKTKSTAARSDALGACTSTAGPTCVDCDGAREEVRRRREKLKKLTTLNPEWALVIATTTLVVKKPVS